MPRKSTPETEPTETPVTFPIAVPESVHHLHAVIAAKLCEIILEAPALAKDERNAFAKYNYVSIDKYYETFAKVAAKNGLTWVTRETDFKIVEVTATAEGREREAPKPRSMAQITYAYDVAVAGMGVAANYSRITVLHGITGPQTAGSAASYAEKLFCRVALKAVTGEKDGDAEEPVTVHAAPNTFPGEAPPKRSEPQRPAVPPPPPPPPAHSTVEEQGGGEDSFIQTTSLDGAAELTTAILAAKAEIERVEKRKYPVFRKRPENVDLIVNVIEAAVPHMDAAELKEFWELNHEFLTAMKEGDADNYKRITPIFQKRLSEVRGAKQ